jgi:hypothetical protein
MPMNTAAVVFSKSAATENQMQDYCGGCLDQLTMIRCRTTAVDVLLGKRLQTTDSMVAPVQKALTVSENSNCFETNQPSWLTPHSSFHLWKRRSGSFVHHSYTIVPPWNVLIGAPYALSEP